MNEVEETGQQAQRPNNVYEMVIEPSIPEAVYSADSWEDEDVNAKNESVSDDSKNGSFNEATLSLLQKLYEINDDPKRKEFLDDLFSFMQKRGTPINRLPIMAKSVLDLYELYNLVIARGGLVDVINKKLWQEIIKGLHLPSSITSAAFTLRTQYMKYLYPYECEKKRLSTPAELQAAIDGNRREGRRSNYTGGYGSGGSGAAESSMVQRSPHTPSSMHVSPLSLVSAVQQVAAVAGGQHPVNPQNLVNGSAAHTPLPHHPHHPQSLQASLGQPQNAGVAPDFEVRMAEYVKHLQREMDARRRAVVSPTSALLAQQQHRPGSTSPPTEATSREALLEMSRLTLWNMYNNNMHPAINYAHNISPHDSPHSPTAQPASPEPQKEALDLGLRSSPSTSSPPNRQSPPSSSGGSVAVKREIERSDSQPEQSTNKRLCLDEDAAAENQAAALPGTHIKISNRGDGRDNSMVVSMEINGVMYQGVLFAQAEAGASGNNSESKTSSRQVTS
ncbi:protein dead ringer isoform X2 [Phymastichus coffea]|uniref:protein dead ringer isoform X2 n=1 Tax=Phymastichus coffea TaxID=108790 RepID=UPI00273BC24D|nr:protein dead ringer isoform X2 [Phymastichus coffea]